MFSELNDLPLWARTITVVLVLLGMGVGVFLLRTVWIPFLVAFLAAYVLQPVVAWMNDRTGLPRTASVVVLLLVGLLIGGFLVVLVVQQTVQLTGVILNVLENPPDLVSSLRQATPAVLEPYLEGLFEQLQPADWTEQLQDWVVANLDLLLGTLQEGVGYLTFVAAQTVGVFEFLIKAGLAFIVTIYFLRDYERIVAATKDLVPVSYRPRLDRVLDEIDRLLRAYLRGYLIVSCVLSVVFFLGFAPLQLQGGLALALLAGFLNIIPYLGPSVGFLLTAAIAGYQFGPGIWLVLTLVFYMLVQTLESSFLTPTIIGEALDLHPVWIIFSLTLFGFLMGMTGILLAIPLAAVFSVLIGEAVKEYKRSAWYRASRQRDS